MPQSSLMMPRSGLRINVEHSFTVPNSNHGLVLASSPLPSSSWTPCNIPAAPGTTSAVKVRRASKAKLATRRSGHLSHLAGRARATLAGRRADGEQPGIGDLKALLQHSLTEGERTLGGHLAAVPTSSGEALDLLHQLVEQTRAVGAPRGASVVAFSGGVDSSLTAYLVHAAFPGAAALACIGRSAALPAVQLRTARQVAAWIGIRLVEVDTAEGGIEEYVANSGSSCYYCKSSLYATLRAVAVSASAAAPGAARPVEAVLFNGTNADDLKDPTRLGLLAALQMEVASPLAALPKAAVRAVARVAGLPNWDLAAAPCLRSRLDFGVPATAQALSTVEAAEAAVRSLLQILPHENMRVRVLADATAIVEIDPAKTAAARTLEVSIRHELKALGLTTLGVRTFRSGALSMKFPT